MEGAWKRRAKTIQTGRLKDRQVWRGLREGAYMLHTNLQADTAEELWSRDMQLTEAEASFRALKSDLSMRLLFHHLTVPERFELNRKCSVDSAIA